MIYFGKLTLNIVLELRKNENSSEEEASHESHGIHVASWNWDHVGIYIIITLFIVLSGLAKVGKLIKVEAHDKTFSGPTNGFHFINTVESGY